ncbi:hypothetical protein [Streptomyces sp. NPDC006463]|uniref:hypothetical protein n=1 Tax=Streptomyces sp. NPDC006463 TaxID=3364746 RepID=UPI0036B3DDC3
MRTHGRGKARRTGLLLGLTGRQPRRLRLRAAVDPQGRGERQQEALLNAAEAGAAYGGRSEGGRGRPQPGRPGAGGAWQTGPVVSPHLPEELVKRNSLVSRHAS